MRQLLHRVPVAVARPELHLPVARVRRQLLLHQADALEERRPVEGRDQPHAGDHVAHRGVHRGLPPVLDLQHVVGRRPLLRQPVVEPGEGRGDVRVLVAQPAEQGHREGDVAQALLMAPQQRRGLGRPRLAQQAVRQRVGLLAHHPGAHHPLGQAPQVLHQHHPDGDRHGPQLAEGQRLDALIGAQEPRQRLRIEQAVGVGHEVVDQGVDPGVALKGIGRQLGQLPVVAGRQVLADLPQLLLDEMEIVDQPLRRRRDGPLVAHRFGDRAVRGEQDPAVVPQARQQPAPSPAARPHPLRLGETGRVLLEPLPSPELLADRLGQFGEEG